MKGSWAYWKSWRGIGKGNGNIAETILKCEILNEITWLVTVTESLTILFYQEKLPKSNAMMNGWMSEIHICVTVSLTILSHSIDSRMFWFESDK